MLLFKFAFVFFVAFLVTSTDAKKCSKKTQSLCANGQSPLAGYFCGRGPTRQDCPATHECIIAPNDAYAVCCPRAEKPGSCPKPSDAIGICIARCTDDSDCAGDLKCCGGCPRECVEPVVETK